MSLSRYPTHNLYSLMALFYKQKSGNDVTLSTSVCGDVRERAPTYLDAGHSRDTPSEERFYGCLLTFWGRFGSIEAVLSDEVDESRLKLL